MSTSNTIDDGGMGDSADDSRLDQNENQMDIRNIAKISIILKGLAEAIEHCSSARIHGPKGWNQGAFSTHNIEFNRGVDYGDFRALRRLDETNSDHCGQIQSWERDIDRQVHGSAGSLSIRSERVLQLALWHPCKGIDGLPFRDHCDYLRLIRSIMDKLTMVEVLIITLST
jgi:hypothetical protein